MKILMVNKFLYPNGGSETYMIRLGEYLSSIGHEVQYFGMYDDRNIVGNKLNSYVSNVNYHNGNLNVFDKLKYSIKSIYSFEAREKISLIINDLKPDIVHLNNINYQITPSILYEIKKQGIPIIQTVHDPQISCPNHRLYIEESRKICTECVHGAFYKCIRNKCIQGSILKSVLASMESYYYHFRNTYQIIDKFICPSKFISDVIVEGGIDNNKIQVIHNFSDSIMASNRCNNKKSYALYFGRLSEEKGIRTLVDVCKLLPEINFIFAGAGPLVDLLSGIPNINYVGFRKGDELRELITDAAFTIYPSEWYENCPLSVIESISYGTPVIASDLGGTKELIQNEITGLVFEGQSKDGLKSSIERLWNDEVLRNKMVQNTFQMKFDSVNQYTNKILDIYSSLQKN